MTVVDDRGRLFGRWNVVDALIGVLLLGAIPLLYGGYALFRAQPPSLTSVEPSRIQAKSNVEVTIRGTNLRPYMRVSFNDNQGRSFLFADQTKAVVQVVDIPPGVYDVILYDNAQERARLPKAFEVAAPPQSQTQVDLIGAFTAIAEASAGQITTQLKFPGLGEVTRVGKPMPSATYAAVGPGESVAMQSASSVNVPAVIHASCALVERSGSMSCNAMDRTLMRDVVLTLPVAGASVFFRIDQVQALGTDAIVDVRVRFAGERAVLDLIHRGDQDVERNNEFAAGAQVTAVGGVTRAGTSVIVSAQPQLSAAPTIIAGELATAEATLRVPAQQTAEGWWYRGQLLKPGRTLVFHHPDYEVSATILSVTAR
jgi:hypothetical protein